MTEPITVEAHFDAEGLPRPLAFKWQGKRFIIERNGRQWEKLGRLHFLVMTPGNHVFELTFIPSENQWNLARSPKNFNRHSLA